MELKVTAVISPNDKDFRMYVVQESQTRKDTQFIHVSSLNQCYGLKINDYVSITNKARMHNLIEIESELNKRIIKN